VKVGSGVIANPGTKHVEVSKEREQGNEASGVQRPVQLHFLVEGEIEPARLRWALQKTAERLSVGIERPEHTNGNGFGVSRAPWQEHDLRGLPREQARKWIRSFLETDSQQEISAQRFPSMRCALILTDNREG
jgi:hypothetical protein